MPGRNVDTARRRRTVFGLEVHHLTTSTVVIVTFAPATAKWLRRTAIAVVASGTLAGAGRVGLELLGG